MTSLCLTRDDLRVYHPISQTFTAIAPPSFPCRSGSLIQIDCRSKDSLTERSHVVKEVLCKSCQRSVTMDVLPDDVLLEIFDCYMDKARKQVKIDAWHTLVHVSRKWRCVVFDSPRRLNLRLLCSEGTLVRRMLTIWPPLPIIMSVDGPSGCNEDNIIGAFEHHDRVCDIRLEGVPDSLVEKCLAEMQKPFPALESLWLTTKDNTPVPVIAETFLGGFAPNLETLWLRGFPFPFPVLQKLLLSTTNIVELSLTNIPHSGYISPKAMVTCLSALTRLQTLDLGFESPRSRPYRQNRRPPPPTRTLLPALRALWLAGASEYLEDLVARIDTPLLSGLDIIFFHRLIFDTPQLAKFIGRSSRRQKEGTRNEIRVGLSDSHVTVSLPGAFAYGLELVISCTQLDWQLSGLSQVCGGSSFPQALIHTMEHLYILDNGHSEPRWQDDIENSQWLEFLHPFTAVKDLFVSQTIASLVAPALQELVGERANEVLPALQSIHWEGLHPSGAIPQVIEQFVTARHLSSHPITVIPWTRTR